MTTTNNDCCGNCGNSTENCECPAGIRGSLTRRGTGVPTIISTDLAGDTYIQSDTTPAGEVWSFNGVTWTDTGFSEQGEQGAAGAAGASILYDDHTPQSTTGTGVYQTLKTYTIPAATLGTDGDQVIITTRFSVTATNNIKGQQIVLGGNTLINFAIGMISESFVAIESVVNRINSTTVAALNTFKIYNAIGNQVGVDYVTYNPSVPVADLASSTTAVSAQADSVTVIGDITCNFLTVEFKHKS